MIALFRQIPVVNYGFKDFILRSDLAPDALEHAAEEQFHSIDPRLPLSEMMTMAETIEDLTNDKRFTSLILTGFAVLGLVLAVMVYME